MFRFHFGYCFLSGYTKFCYSNVLYNIRCSIVVLLPFFARVVVYISVCTLNIYYVHTTVLCPSSLSLSLSLSLFSHCIRILSLKTFLFTLFPTLFVSFFQILTKWSRKRAEFHKNKSNNSERKEIQKTRKYGVKARGGKEIAEIIKTELLKKKKTGEERRKAWTERIWKYKSSFLLLLFLLLSAFLSPKIAPIELLVSIRLEYLHHSQFIEIISSTEHFMGSKLRTYGDWQVERSEATKKKQKRN